MFERLLTRLNNWASLTSAGETQEDLKLSRIKPSLKMYTGIGVICLSYLTCWPLIGLLGWLAFEFEEQLIFSIGSPVAYLASHCLFLVGAFIAGSEGVGYARLLMAWLARTILAGRTKAGPKAAVDAESDRRTATVEDTDESVRRSSII